MPEPSFIPHTKAIRRVARALAAAAVAFVALGAGAASAHADATITITQHTQPAGDPTAFSFHLERVGGACPRNPSDLTFELRDGESKSMPLCRGQAFKVTQTAPPGWGLVDIRCVATPPDQDPDDAFIIDLPAGTATIELSPEEQKACEFVNARTPTPPTVTPPGGGTPPAGGASPGGATPVAGGAPQPPAQQQVSPEVVVRSAASLQAPKRCVSRRYTVFVRARRVRTVAFFVNGRRVATLRGRPGLRRYTMQLGAQVAVARIVVRVSFTQNARPRTRTLRATVRRCAAAQVSPQFTG